MTPDTNVARVHNVRVSDIAPNPHNPRRLFDEEPMRILEESIKKLGVLVPVTVYRATSSRHDGRYVLLDGERRWRCARILKRVNIPAIVIQKPSDEQNILTMFHIHNVREGWQLMPTALKLKVLMDRLEETNERKLNELTQLSIAQIRRCKILLTYPRKYQDMMLAPVSERMKADFFIELQRIRGPAIEEHLRPWTRRGDSRCIEILLDKYEREVVKAVTDFRRIAEVYRASVRLGKKKLFVRRFDHFLAQADATIDEISVPGATFAKEAKEIQRTARRLLNQVEAIELEWIASDGATIKLLSRLVRTLQKKLDQALLTGPRHAAGED
jgi:ParB family chromosome partitioning protein